MSIIATLIGANKAKTGAFTGLAAANTADVDALSLRNGMMAVEFAADALERAVAAGVDGDTLDVNPLLRRILIVVVVVAVAAGECGAGRDQ